MFRQGESPAVCKGPELLYRFTGNLDVLRADLPAGLATGAGKEAFLYGSRDPVIDVSWVERKAHLLAHGRRSQKLCYIHCRTYRYAAEALDTRPQGFHRIDIGFCWHF